MEHISIKKVGSHYEAYVGNDFLCSGDSLEEVYEIAEELLN